jgi:hypothetical protein
LVSRIGTSSPSQVSPSGFLRVDAGLYRSTEDLAHRYARPPSRSPAIRQRVFSEPKSCAGRRHGYPRIRKLIFAAAAVSSGTTPSSHADTFVGTVSIPSWKQAISGSSQHPQPAANLSKQDIRQTQLELRHSGLYNGPLDGVIGPQTRQALVRFQKDNGLEQTATLDALTMAAMFGNIGTSQGSTSPNAGQGSGQ